MITCQTNFSFAAPKKYVAMKNLILSIFAAGALWACENEEQTLNIEKLVEENKFLSEELSRKDSSIAAFE